MKQRKTLDLQGREIFERAYADGARVADIAVRLDIHISTAYRELERGLIFDAHGDVLLDNNQRPKYSAPVAQRRAQEALRHRGARRAAAERA